MSLMDNVKQLDTKQKGMLIALIGCVGLVLYLVYSTFFVTEEASSLPAPSPVVQTTPVEQASFPSNALEAPAPQYAASTTQRETGAVQIGQPAPATPESLTLLAQSQQMQQAYIELVNQYQLAQLQQKLAQVDAQIAASKLTTTKSLVELRKLQPELGQNDNNMPGEQNNSPAQAGYQTMYVGQISGQWQAMLQSNGQYFQVSTGMRLPDGSMVSSITSKGVVLTRDGTPTFLPISKNLD